LFISSACPGNPVCSSAGKCYDKVKGNGTCTCMVRLIDADTFKKYKKVRKNLLKKLELV
jgi:hypothetical protein